MRRLPTLAVGVWLIVLIQLSGCGFQLRGSVQQLPQQLQPLILWADSRYHALRQTLSQRLPQATITHAQLRQDGVAALQIYQLNSRLHRRSLGASAGQQLYRLELTLEFALLSPEGEPWIARRPIVRGASLQFDGSNPQGLEQQQALLEQGLLEEIVDELIIRLSYPEQWAALTTAPN